VPISQEFAEFIEAIGLLIQAASVRAASTGTGSRIEELESACALLRAQIERADKVLNKPAPPVASQKGKEDKTVSNIPDLRLYECSWKNSLIRLWIPLNYTAEDIANIKEMWSLMIRQFERKLAATVPPETTKPDHDLHNEACGCIPLPKPVLAKGFALTTPEGHTNG
jgi:hypothetical protein